MMENSFDILESLSPSSSSSPKMFRINEWDNKGIMMITLINYSFHYPFEKRETKHFFEYKECKEECDEECTRLTGFRKLVGIFENNNELLIGFESNLTAFYNNVKSNVKNNASFETKEDVHFKKIIAKYFKNKKEDFEIFCMLDNDATIRNCPHPLPTCSLRTLEGLIVDRLESPGGTQQLNMFKSID